MFSTLAHSLSSMAVVGLGWSQDTREVAWPVAATDALCVRQLRGGWVVKVSLPRKAAGPLGILAALDGEKGAP